VLEKKVNERTRERNKALANEKQIVEMKNKFVSIASHEMNLSSPVSSVLKSHHLSIL
jgi:hypothetical protein